MKKKQLLIMIASIALVATVGVGATLAYLTDQEEAVNVVTMGHVEIDLTEPHFDKTDGDENNKVEDLCPGEEIAKDPTITVKANSEDAYIRARINYAGLSEQEIIDLKLDINNADWYYNADENFYYYQKLMKPNEKAVLFNKVKIPSTWDKDDANKNFKISIYAEAIQADYFHPEEKIEGTDGKEVTLIRKWVDAGGKAITAENYGD